MLFSVSIKIYILEIISNCWVTIRLYKLFNFINVFIFDLVRWFWWIFKIENSGLLWHPVFIYLFCFFWIEFWLFWLFVFVKNNPWLKIFFLIYFLLLKCKVYTTYLNPPRTIIENLIWLSKRANQQSLSSEIRIDIMMMKWYYKHEVI